MGDGRGWEDFLLGFINYDEDTYIAVWLDLFGHLDASEIRDIEAGGALPTFELNEEESDGHYL